ncbi:MAG: T9SS type A sorting domain-containing protein, partial [Flavobacteriales bacterium]
VHDALYPDPVSPGGWIHVPDGPAGTFLVWGLNGQVVCESHVGPSSSAVLLPNHIAPGVYMASVVGNGEARRYKLIVQ